MKARMPGRAFSNVDPTGAGHVQLRANPGAFPEHLNRLSRHQESEVMRRMSRRIRAPSAEKSAR
jgi:hypothetical protein